MKMSRINLPIVMLFIFSGLMTSAHAQVYISGQLGLGVLQDSTLTEDGETIDVGYDNGLIFAGAFGVVRDNLRGEVELAYQSNDISSFGLIGVSIDPSVVGLSGDVSGLTGLLNGYIDFDMGNNLTPYLGAGIGMTKVNVKLSFDDIDLGTVSEDDSDTVLSYHFGGGIAYTIAENMMLDLRYRYFLTSDPKIDGVKIDVKSHQIMGGLRVNF